MYQDFFKYGDSFIHECLLMINENNFSYREKEVIIFDTFPFPVDRF